MSETLRPPVDALQRAGHSTWIEIRLDRFRENLRRLRLLSGAPYLLAVVKANAYGHGLIETARAIKDEVTYLGVSSLHELLELKEHGISTRAFLFGRLFGEELVSAVKTDATLSVSSLEEAEEISKISSKLGHLTKIHIKIDTGMGRLGIPEREAIKTILKIADLPNLLLEGLYTHFPTAEREDGFTESQYQKFGLVAEALEAKGITFTYRHTSNSAGSLRIKSPILNMNRPGLILYGISPFPESPTSMKKETDPFAPVLSLKSRIILVKKILPGESVGYGRDFKVDEPVNVATLPVGYSHGYSWTLSNKAQVLYRGKRYPLAGRVSMDYISFNLGQDSAQAGDEVTLIGEDGSESLRAEELARWAGTIPYEIVTRLSPRIPRLYLS